MFLTKEKLLARQPLKVQKVDLSDGEYVYIRQMTGKERDSYERSMMRKIRNSRGEVTYEHTLDNFRAKLAVRTLCDEHGELLLTANDVEALSEGMSAERLSKIVTAAQELNGITAEEREEIEKNSETAQEDSSTFD